MGYHPNSSFSLFIFFFVTPKTKRKEQNKTKQNG